MSHQDKQLNAITFFTNYGNDPCAYLRVRGPMKHLGVEIIDGVSVNSVYPERVLQGDVVLIQRDFPRSLLSYEQVIQVARQNNKPVIFDIDDLLLLMPKDHPDRQSQHYIESLLPMMQALYEADLVTTTTAILQSWLSEYNPHVRLLPNYFDDTLWQLRKPTIKEQKERPTIIGYMGSESHKPDIEFIAPVLLNLLETYSDGLAFYFWGAKPPVSMANYPQVKWIPAVSYQYENFAAYFQTQFADIFIAPLVDNLFNRAKSPLKFFEYSALGVPGVYSKLETFEQAIIHNHDGLLAASLDEWQSNLVRLIEDPALRLQIADNAQETIQDKWMLSKNVDQWSEVYNGIRFEFQGKPTDNKPLFRTEVIRSLNHQYYDLLYTTKNDLKNKNNIILETMAELAVIKNSRAWKMVIKIRQIRDKLIPPDTAREKYINAFLQWMQGKKAQRIIRKRKQSLESLLNIHTWLTDCQKVTEHSEQVDVIICVHNALLDVQKCLQSVITFTTQPFKIIIVDDGSDDATKVYLEQFASAYRECTLIRNDEALGYTLAANIGMRASEAPFFVLLNSDTVVTPHWVDRLYRAMVRDDTHGIVGPLSNTASWQSIPKLSDNGDWAVNQIPNGLTPEDIAVRIAKDSACIHPKVPLLNGFCMMIRRALVEDIGIFDEDNFGQGYGEEDDFNLRAADSGWHSVIADDVFIYHAQSKSYSHEMRYALTSISGEKLRNKHGAEKIASKVEFMNPNRLMEGIRARSAIMLEREDCIDLGRKHFAGKRVLFVLPVLDAGGGANVILDEAKHMLDMGVNVSIFNLQANKTGFLKNYAHSEIPCIFGKIQDLPNAAAKFDAIVASAHYSVPWLEPLLRNPNKPILGYYVQGFEALMYKEDSENYQQAKASYTSIAEMKRFTKTRWTKNTVYENTGADSDVVGISVNIDLFRPRDMIPMGLRPVTIVAMVRPGSPYRNPEMTMSILRQISKKYKGDVDIWLFGADDVRDVVDDKLLDFDWQQLGKLTQVQVASMMSKADIFTDFSSHQAMGLSALEAMAAGCSVIVPKNGGAIEFVNHRENGIVADTAFEQASLAALEELIENDQLRKQIQINGINDVVQYFPERVSYNILRSLFS
jgi:GT2 family glycosyltransferase/glycosyltransferase involved in cell wall biosynthesis